MRTYHNLFRKNFKEIDGIKKIIIHACSRKENEPINIHSFKIDKNKETLLFLFKGYQGYFDQLNDWNQFLYDELIKITQEKWMRVVNRHQNLPPIGIHVRLGDKVGFQSNPIAWFMSSLDSIRSAAGYSVGAFVVSDGRPDELKPLLSQKNVCLIKTGSAVGDLLLLTKSKILIGTGCSSFTAWASFMREVPTLTIPGQSLSWFQIRSTKKYYFSEFDPASRSQETFDFIMPKLNL